MSKKLSNARLRHLQNASNILSTSSRAVSAHLGSVYNELSGDGASRDTSPTHCAACGSNLALARPHRIARNAGMKRTRKDRLDQANRELKSIKLECSVCSRVTVLESKKPPQKDLNANNAEMASVSDDHKMQSEKPNQVLPAAPSVKKRARGKKASLQSIMEGKKASAASVGKATGLSLQDFRKL
jgi:hypothetical protein